MSLLQQIHLDTKALVIINEYLRIRRDFGTLASFLNALAVDRSECSQILQTISQHLGGAGYQESDIDYLVQGIRQALAAQTTARHDTPVVPVIPIGIALAPGAQRAPASPPTSPVPRTRQPFPAPVAPVAAALPGGAAADEPAAEQELTAFARAQAKGRSGTMLFERRPSSPPPRPPLVRSASTPHAPDLRLTPPRGSRAILPGSTQNRNSQQFGASAGTIDPDAVRVPERPTVLLAEDDARARMVYKTKLEAAGFNTVEAADGTEAWHRIKSGGIYAVVLDIKLPGINGIEILSRMHDMKIHLPVVVCTSFSHIKDEFIVRTYPKLKYMVKPVDPDQIIEAIREMLGTPAQ